MPKNKNKDIANETMQTINAGYYTINDKIINISEQIAYTNSHTAFISEQDANDLEDAFIQKSTLPKIELCDETTLSAIIRLSCEANNLGTLNFASAKNPGGGFLNGAMAQEESLAVASALYPSQLQRTQYYAINRRCKSFVYTDCAIWSPDVIFFRDDSANFLMTPAKSHVLTIPGVNFGQVLLKGEDTNAAKIAMKRRMKIALAIFANMGCDMVILGAFGCGVFRNNPADVAMWWNELLNEYGGHFNRIVFSIYDRSRLRATYKAFCNYFQA